MKGKARILVVDDNCIITKILVDILRIKSCDGEEANSGREALGKINSLQFDAMLSDIMMPDMNGVELLLAAK